MSRTFRRIPTHTNQPLMPRKNDLTPASSFIQTTPDGKRDMTVEIMRDNRASGLRSHRADRRQAKTILRTCTQDILPVGKMRRYSLQYGDYEY